MLEELEEMENKLYKLNEALWDHIPFECTKCGKCCHGVRFINLTIPEIIRISKRLGLTPKKFVKKYCIIDGYYIYLKRKEGKSGITCVFQENNLCKIHDVKPFQCRFYPFYSTRQVIYDTIIPKLFDVRMIRPIIRVRDFDILFGDLLIFLIREPECELSKNIWLNINDLLPRIRPILMKIALLRERLLFNMYKNIAYLMTEILR